MITLARERVEDLPLEQFVAELRVEAFTVARSPIGLPRLDVGGSWLPRLQSTSRDSLGEKLRAIVRTNVPRDSRAG